MVQKKKPEDLEGGEVGLVNPWYADQLGDAPGLLERAPGREGGRCRKAVEGVQERDRKEVFPRTSHFHHFKRLVVVQIS